MRGRFRLVLVAAGVGFSVAAEAVQFGLDDPSRWIPDLAVGWAFIACGLIASGRRPDSRSGPLMLATGFAWFLGNFSHSGEAAIGWAAAHVAYVYLGSLYHLLLAYPSGRALARLARMTIAVGYLASIAAVWLNEIATIVLAALLVAVCARGYMTTVGRFRQARLLAVWATIAVSGVLTGYAAFRLLLPPASVSASFVLAYQGTLIAVAVGLLGGLLPASSERSGLTDLVVELGENRTGSLRAALAEALADPSLEVGYWLPDADAFVDTEGRRIAIPEPGSGRSATMIEHDRGPIAVLVHDRAVLGDAALSAAVASAMRLAASNSQLQAEVGFRLTELRESRRRVLDAGDDERRRLEQRLREGAERRLIGLAEILDDARSEGEGMTPAALSKIDRARAELDGTVEELQELGRGLHPRILSELGLAPALAALAERSPVPVDLTVRAAGLPPPVEAAAYFLCSEALANVSKHAAATRVAISVEVHDRSLRLLIRDDGVGGAHVADGSGMRGLADRVEALGGAFHLDSPSGRGTRLACVIPLGNELNANG